MMAFRREWQLKLHAAGWAGISWPKEYGGRGATMIEQAIFVAEAARLEAPSPANVLGLAMGGPVVIAHGTDEQKQRYLEPILTGEEIWCQGFSEPESGSDLASLKTRAVKDGDEWVVTGQKVWTTFAQYAKWCMLVARTDPDAPKHKGLTYFLMDMEQEGVAGPAAGPDHRRGRVQRGLHRGGADPRRERRRRRRQRLGGGDHDADERARRARLRRDRPDRTTASRRLAELAAETPRQRRHRGRGPRLPPADRPAPHRGRDDAAQRLPRPDQDDAVRHPRPGGLARQVAVGRHQPGRSPSWRSRSRAPTRRSSRGAEHAVANGAWQYSFLRSRANSIEGGTTDILKNIIAERVLGLPRMR